MQVPKMMDLVKKLAIKTSSPEIYSRVYLRLLRLVSRLPQIDHEQIESVIIEAPRNDRRALELEYKELKRGERSKLITYSLVASIFFAAKNFLAIIKTMRWFNYSDLESNFKLSVIVNKDNGMDTRQQQQQLELACMATDCSRLSDRRSLMEDMAELPIFEICDPLAKIILMPMKYLPKVGLILFALAGFSALINGVFVPALQMLTPTGNECLLFVQAPGIGLRLIKMRIREVIQREVVCSYRRLMSPTARRVTFSSHGQYHQDLSPMMPLTCSSFQISTAPKRGHSGGGGVRYEVATVGEGLLRLNDEPDLMSKFREQFVDDCVPAVRRNWFRSKQLRTLQIAHSFMLFYGLVVTLTSCYAIMNMVLLEKEHQLRQFGLEAREQNCSIWLTTATEVATASAGSAPPIVDLNTLSLRWSLSGVLEMIYFQFIPANIALSVILLFHLTIIELVCWQSELRNQLLFLIECRRLITAMKNLPDTSMNDSLHSSSADWDRSRALFYDGPAYHELLERSELALAKFRHRFEDANKYIPFLMTGSISTKSSEGSSSRLRVSLALRGLSSSVLMEFDPNTEYNIDHDDMVFVLIMEKVYVNFRLYLDHIDHCGPFISLIISFWYVLFYGFVALAIWFVNHIAESTMAALSIVIASWVMLNTMLMMASSVHARGKRLHFLIWSLIAQLDKAENQQERCLRYLWVKQVEHVDNERGAALKMVGFKITHVKSIQLVIWTATIFVFALRY